MCCGKTETILSGLEFSISILLATTIKGIFLASKLPIIVILVCVRGSEVASTTRRTPVTSSNHLIASIIPLVASLALFLASSSSNPNSKKF